TDGAPRAGAEGHSGNSGSGPFHPAGGARRLQSRAHRFPEAAMSWKLPWTAHLGLRGPDGPLFRHSAQSADPFDQIDFIADLGFAGVQDNYAALRPAEEQERVAAHAARHGLKMASFVHDPM